MFNLTTKLLCIGIAAAILGLPSRAMAGEGGIAAAASFLIDDAGNVTDSSIAVAIGKSGAYAGSQTATGVSTEAVAAGAGGEITLQAGTIYVSSIAEDTNLDTAQSNELNNFTISIDPDATPVTIELP